MYSGILFIYLLSHPVFGGTSCKGRFKIFLTYFATDFAIFKMAESNKLITYFFSCKKKKENLLAKSTSCVYSLLRCSTAVF